MSEQQVNVRLSDVALKDLDLIQKEMDFGTRSQAITFVTKFTKYFVDMEKDGVIFYVEYKDKSKGRIIMV